MPAILFLITDLHRGGSPLLLADLAPGLRGCGWEVGVVSIAPLGEVAGILQERGVEVVSLEAGGSKDLSVVPRFVKLVRRRKPDVVCSILVHGNLLASMAKAFLGADVVGKRIKWVQSIHTLQEKPRWHWRVQGILSAHADGFVAPSQAVVDKVASFGPIGGVGAKVGVIRNGIDVGRFFHARPLDEVPWPQGSVVVGSVSRFDVVKRLDVMICALQKLPERFHLALVGYGPDEGRLKRLAGELGLQGRVHFPGAVKDPERWYKTFDVFCSLSASEGYGLSVVEAVCAGCPVVAADVPVMRETVGEEEVFWVSREGVAAEVAGILGAAGQCKGRRTLELATLEARYGVGRCGLGKGEGMVGGYDLFLRELLGFAG